MTDTPRGPTRLLVLGFDAANPDLLERWASDGTLPVLGGLQKRGLRGRTRSLEGFIHSTWPSFCTGVSPAQHGYHYITQLKPGTYQYAMQSMEEESFWTSLSRAGRRVAIFDVPLSQPDPAINGIHVVDWGVIEQWTTLRTVPASLQSQVLANWGEHPLQDTGDDLRSTTADQAALLDVLCRGARTRADMSLQYLAEGPWDLFLQTFTESHCAGHNMWHQHDPEHPSHDPATHAAIGDPIQRIYQEIDAAMGRIIEAAGDAIVLVVSAHGMSHWYSGEFALGEILFRLGAAERRPAAPIDRSFRALAIRGVRAAWQLVPRALRHRVFLFREGRRRRRNLRPPVPSIDADVTRSRCFRVRNGHLTAGIRLNLIGREPTGVLAPGSEADRFVAQLTADLLEIIDERTGRPLIRAVRRTRDLHSGKRVNELPDLLVDWDDEVATGNSNLASGAGATLRVRSPKIGVVEARNDYSRTGDHRIEGMFVAVGPGIQPGQMEHEVSIMDFAPTFCRMLGVEPPESDGTPITELIPAP